MSLERAQGDVVTGAGRGVGLAPLFGQVGISISNMLIGIALIRYGSPQEYGSFVLGLSIALFFVGVQDGLISVPVMVRAGALGARQRQRYLVRNQRSLHTLVIGAAIAGLVLCEAARAVVPVVADRWLVLAVSGVCVAWIAWDYQRSAALALRAPAALLRVDAAYLAAVAAGVATALWASAISATMALAAIFLAASVAAATGIRGEPVFEVRSRALSRTAKLWWARGRFSLSANLVSWVQSQGYIYICSALMGVEALARVAAARLLFAPVATCLAAWLKGSTTRGAMSFQAGHFAVLERRLWRAAIGFVALVLVWCALVFAGLDFVTRRFFGDGYQDMTPLLVCWAFGMMATVSRAVWQLGVRASGSFRQWMHIAAAGAVVSVGATVAATAWLGETGPVLGLGVGEGLVAFMAFTVFRRKVAEKVVGRA